MSKEQDFHKLIREQNQAEKDSLWRKIEQQQDEEVVELGEVLGKRHGLSRKIAIIAGLFICIFAALIILVCTLTKKDEKTIRYCVNDEYYFLETDISIEQYALDNEKELLFFDWYEESEYFIDQQYKLKATDEVICLSEELVDLNGVYIVQNITDINTQLDFLDIYYTNCDKSIKIKSCEVQYGFTSLNSYAYFTFNNHKYYLSIEALANGDYILGLVEYLLK